VAARHADVLVQRRIAVDRRLLRRHDSVRQRVDARDRQGQCLRPAKFLGPQVVHVRRRPHRVGDQPVQRLDEGGRLAAGGIEGHGAAEGDHRPDALRGLVRSVHGEQTAQAPADEAHLPAVLVMHVADLLLQRGRVPAAEADVAPEAPGLHLVAPVLQEELEHDQRSLVRHESRKQQHRVAIAAPSVGEHGQKPRQRGHLEDGARLDQLVQQGGLSDVRFSRGHLRSGRLSTGVATNPSPPSAWAPALRMT